jgi:hypothetical protein
MKGDSDENSFFVTYENEIIKKVLINEQSPWIVVKFYQENKDPNTGMLIFTVSRQTTAKWVKGLASYYLGY